MFDVFLANRLINMYSNCNSIQCAQRVFDELPSKNSYSWNTIISAYSRIGCFRKARQLLDEMPEPTLVSYNSLISGLTHHGFYEESVKIFTKMQNEYDFVFMDEFTVVSVVGSCACLGALKWLRQVHGVSVVIGLKFNVVMYNALIDAYGKCRQPDNSYIIFNLMPERDVVSWTSMVVAYAQASKLVEACWVFDQMRTKNTVSWTALIAGFAQNGQPLEALGLFEKMQAEGIVPPSAFTYVSVLSACADLALIERGKQLHGCITRRSNMNFSCNLFLSNALIDMYSKCGDMKSMVTLFERIHVKDIVTWNSMITGFAQNGQGEQSLAIFNRMIESNIKPNDVTFLGVLSACAHTGQLHEGFQILDLMEKVYGVIPKSDHYSVLIDLLGRTNKLNEALDMIMKNPTGLHRVGMWGALLGSCRIHANLDLARRAAEALFELEPENSGRYVMLSNIYAAAGRWDDVSLVRKLMDQRGLQKEAACSWTDIKGLRGA